MKRILIILIILFSSYVNGQPLHIYSMGTPSNFFVFNKKLYFQGSDVKNINRELWVYDNSIPISVTNPKMLIDMDSTTSSGSFPSLFTEYNEKLFFRTNKGLYSFVDTLPISQTNPRFISNPGNGLTIYNDKLYFDFPSSLRTIYVFDDNLPVSGTNPKALVSPDVNYIKTSNYFIPIIYQNRMFFTATNDQNTGEELWVYDSSIPTSTTNPYLLADINLNYDFLNPSNNGSNPRDFIVFKNKLYFSANDNTGMELWVYDNLNNPQKVFDINPGTNSGGATSKTIYDDSLFFSYTNITYGTELWCYDGINNPSLVADIYFGQNYSIPNDLKVFGDRLVFNYNDSIHGRELWVFNKHQTVSTSNPFLITDLNPGSSDGVPYTAYYNINYRYVQYGQYLYFGGCGNNSIDGLWALSLCDIGAALTSTFNIGSDTTIAIGDTLILKGPDLMTSYKWSNGLTNNQISFIGDSSNIGSNFIILSVIDSNSCYFADSIKITVTSPSSITTLSDNDINFSIFPNPTSGRFNILASKNIEEILITNSFGQIIFHDMPNKKNVSFTINVDGIYFVVLTSGNQTITRKLFII